VPHLITDGFEGEVGIDQTLNTSVSECMRAGASYDNACLAKIMGRPLGNGSGIERLKGSQNSEENMSILRVGPAMPQIVHDGLANNG